MICAEPTFQNLATGFPVGMRFHSAPMVRLAGAKPMQLARAARADGAWRIYAFTDSRGSRISRPVSARYARFWIRISLRSGGIHRRASPSTRIDFRAVFEQMHRDLAVHGMPAFLLPRKGRFGLIDYEKMFCPDLKAGTDIFEVRGVDRRQGCMVVADRTSTSRTSSRWMPSTHSPASSRESRSRLADAWVGAPKG